MRFVPGVVATTMVALLACCASTNDPTTSSATLLPSGVFISDYAHGSGDLGGGNGTYLSLFDLASGVHLRDLVHLQDGSVVHLAGYSRDSDGTIVFALAQGPEYQSGAADGDPKADTCGGAVRQIRAASGRSSDLFTVGKDRTVREPAASPDGTSVAYLSEPCTAALAQALVTRDLASGTEHRVWMDRASVTGLGWASDGAHLVVTVMFPDRSGAADAPGFMVVPAEAEGPQDAGALRHAPDRGCVVVAAVFTGPGVLLAEGCPNLVTAPARLVQLADAGPRVLWRAGTGLCPNGMTLAPAAQGTVLVTGTTACGSAVDVVQSWTGQRAREVGRYVHPQQFVAAAS